MTIIVFQYIIYSFYKRSEVCASNLVFFSAEYMRSMDLELSWIIETFSTPL